MQYYKNKVNSNSGEENTKVLNKDKMSTTDFLFMLGFSMTDHETDSAIVVSMVYVEMT